MGFRGIGGTGSYGLAGRQGPFTSSGRSGINDFLFGKDPTTEQLPTMSGGQSQLFEQLIAAMGGQGGALDSGMQNLMGMLSGDPAALEAFQAPAMRQFEEKIVPGIAERFSGGLGTGGMGGQSSSAFGQTLGAAGAGLAENLSAQRAGLQSGAMDQLMKMLGLGIGKQTFGYKETEGTQGLFGGMAEGGGQAFMQMLPYLMMM